MRANVMPRNAAMNCLAIEQGLTSALLILATSADSWYADSERSVVALGARKPDLPACNLPLSAIGLQRSARTLSRAGRNARLLQDAREHVRHRRTLGLGSRGRRPAADQRHATSENGKRQREVVVRVAVAHVAAVENGRPVEQ